MLNFICPRCAREGELEDGDGNGVDEGPGLVVNGGMLQEVEQFCYLGDVLDCESGVERAVRARVTAAWRRWREIANLLVNLSIGLGTRGRVYEASVTSSQLYGAETWPLTSRLHRCDHRKRDTWQKSGGKMGGLTVG